MKGIKSLILLAVLFFTPYAYAQPISCPCDTHELPNGTTGNDIIELLCPGGELAEGVSYDLTAHIARVTGDGKGYSVQIIPDSTGCGIVSMGQAEGIPTSTEEAEVCRTGLIQRCGLTLVTPIPAISEWGMIAAAAGLGIIGLFIAVRRKKAAA